MPPIAPHPGTPLSRERIRASRDRWSRQTVAPGPLFGARRGGWIRRSRFAPGRLTKKTNLVQDRN